MKKFVFLLLIVAGCQTAKIQKKEYKISDATIELGSIGWAKSLYNLDNDFSIHGFPVLENKVRIDVAVHPFDENMYKIYTQKSLGNQAAAKITYTDSLPVKPEYVTVNIMDMETFSSELNRLQNRDIFNYLKDTEKSVMVIGIATVLPVEDLAKIKLADAYYLINNQEKKYTIALFKSGKKTGTIDLPAGTELAYILGKFCWALNEKQHWYISDIVKDSQSCKGNTRSKVKAKQEKNLFKM